MTAVEHDQPPRPERVEGPRPLPPNVLAFPGQPHRDPYAQPPPVVEENDQDELVEEPGYGHGV